MQKIYERKIKRVLDIVLSLSAILLLLPIFTIVSILVFFKLSSPILFKQKRPGKNENIFNIYKFRTMSTSTNDDGSSMSDESRLTNFGKILRSTSLDELPSLINILKGDMSIVGPRPLLVSYLSLYNEEQKRRHLVRPGLTGLAQINGRNNLDWNSRFLLDIEYVDNISFRNDLVIIFKTIKKVFIREGITEERSATMTPFEGNE